MPSLPVYEQRTRLTGAGLGPGPTGLEGRGLQAIGQALQDVAADTALRREEDAALWATQALSAAQTHWTQQLLERQEQAEEGAPDFTPTLLRDYDAYVGEVVNEAPTRAARDFLQQRLIAYRASLAERALTFEAAERASYTESVAKQSIDAARTEAFQQPERFAELLAERLTLIEHMRLTPERKRQLAEDAQRLIATEAVAGMVDANTPAAIELLRSPVGQSGVLAIEALTAEDRSKLMEFAERKRIADEERAYKLAERFERDIQDAASKEGDELLATGQLTARWIEANRDRLSAQDYRYFYHQLMNPQGGGDAPANPMIYADLRERASRGEDIRDEAREALRQNAIRVTDYNTLLSEVESTRPNWYRRGIDYISTSAGVSDLNPDPAAAQRKAQMLEDWHAWAEQHAQATDEEARQEYQRIVREYAIIDTQQMTITMRTPRYLVGSRMRPNIDETELRTVEAFERGQIDSDEFARQAQLIQQWREALERMQQQGQ